MKGFGTTLMLASAVIFLAALLFLTAGKFSMVWVILLIAAPFAFILGIPFATGSGPEYLPSNPKLAQKAREKRDAELGLGFYSRDKRNVGHTNVALFMHV